MNTQLLVYGVIFSLGFIFFYLFFAGMDNYKKLPYNFWGSVVASLYFIFSPYIVTHTYFREQYLAIFLLMVLPGCLYFFVSGRETERACPRVIVFSLFYSVFSSTVFSFPWLLPVVFTLIPFFIYLIFRYGKYFWKMASVYLSSLRYFAISIG